MNCLLRFFGVALILDHVVFAAYKYTPCKKEDTKCLTEIMKLVYTKVIEGDEVSGIETSDPLLIDNVYGDLATIHYELKNNTLFGLKDCDIRSVELSKDNTFMTFKLYYPKTHFIGHYSVNGSLFEIPVYGNGDYSFELYEYWITIKADLKYFRTEEGTYISYQKLKLDADLKGGIDFKVDNLFDGNKQLADALFTFVKANWKPIIDTLQMPALETGYKKVFKNINAFLKKFGNPFQD